jgi:hypothetical protein
MLTLRGAKRSIAGEGRGWLVHGSSGVNRPLAIGHAEQEPESGEVGVQRIDVVGYAAGEAGQGRARLARS